MTILAKTFFWLNELCLATFWMIYVSETGPLDDSMHVVNALECRNAYAKEWMLLFCEGLDF